MSCALVLVSHSKPLALAVQELASQMLPAKTVPIFVAAGSAEGGIGTDTSQVVEAINSAAATSKEVVVFVDLGSAIMSTQTAIEFLDPEIAQRTFITKAPLVEGAVAGAVPAALGKSAAQVMKEAELGLLPKQKLLAD